MPVSRPILIALVGAVAVLVAFMASNVMRSGGEESSPPAPTASESPAQKPAKPGPAGSRAPAARPKAAKAAGSSSQRRASASTSAKRSAPVAAGAPARVERAVKRGRTVVLFFFQRGGADDSATAAAVASVRGRRGVSVFTAPVSKVGDFRAITGNLGLSQAPAVVIVGKKAEARVVEGFIDPETLVQEVADSR